ncbi:hypothetical protein Tco_0685880 [Tanacetum coccineum]
MVVAEVGAEVHMMMGTMIQIHCVTATSTNALAAADKRATVSLLLVSVVALLYFVDYVILFSSTMSSGRKTGGWQGIDHPCGQSSDFGWMETVGSSIETNESVLVWQYRDANSGFGFAHAKEMLDHRVSWQTNLLLSKVSNISLNSNLSEPWEAGKGQQSSYADLVSVGNEKTTIKYKNEKASAILIMVLESFAQELWNEKETEKYKNEGVSVA